LEMVGSMKRNGVRLLAGTDVPAPNVVPGFSLHDELALLVQAGLSPMQALQTATRNPAEALGVLSSRGTVEPGKIADLVLLETNPLEEIANTSRIAAVILRGQFIPKTSLEAMLANSARMALRN
jgi:imidazolonepropionase-like amidohydrolase